VILYIERGGAEKYIMLVDVGKEGKKGKRKVACNKFSHAFQIWEISGLEKMVLIYEFPLAILCRVKSYN
jgi:hypothetical protein